MIASEQIDRGVAEYRPISGWALAALFIGLVSFVALFHPLLWSVPMAGVVVSLIALLRISHADVPLVGRKAALIGLAFSLLYGVAAPARVASRDYWLRAGGTIGRYVYGTDSVPQDRRGVRPDAAVA